MAFIVKSGSQQYIVEQGQKLIVNKLDVPENSEIDLEVLFAIGGDKMTKTIKAKVLAHQKGEKLRVVKYRAKSNYHKVYGPRQHQTLLEITK
jgi:large subunit ribosomal protein L21